jgi:molybdopterin-guanine dinucleotide biosynthesis protein A
MQSSKLTLDTTVGVILAGGRSSRMGGGDKFLQPVAGTDMLTLVHQRFAKQIGTIIISANGAQNSLSSYNIPIVPDVIEGYAGPLAGIHAAMRWARLNHPAASHILSIAADTPFFPQNYTNAMLSHAESIEPESIILAKSHGRFHPIFGLWPISLEKELEQALSDGLRKIRAWTVSQKNSSLEFPDIKIGSESVDPFFNVNEPSDLEQCERLIKTDMA